MDGEINRLTIMLLGSIIRLGRLRSLTRLHILRIMGDKIRGIIITNKRINIKQTNSTKQTPNTTKSINITITIQIR